jgi:hypothetical protein
MDAGQVMMLRELLSTTGWLDRTREFAHALRTSTKDPGGLLLVGTPDDEPWHLAAHLDDESRLNSLPELSPQLIRHNPKPDDRPHLRIGLDRIAATRRGETLFVVAPQATPAHLLERVNDARRTGATILALDTGDEELEGLAHETLTVAPGERLVTFDAAQHLVSRAAGEPQARRGLRDRLARFLDAVSGPPAEP